MSRRLILASKSFYRARLLQGAGYRFGAVPANVDERALDDRFAELGPDAYALALAEMKAVAVRDQLRERGLDAVVVGADQIAVLDGPDGPRLLHQPGTPERAVAQLLEMSGASHHLVNGVVLADTRHDEVVREVDRHRITMRTFSEDDARAYVEEFAPLDCAGSYRLEDDADLIASVEGEDSSGVIGLPLPTLERLLAAAGVEVERDPVDPATANGCCGGGCGHAH